MLKRRSFFLLAVIFCCCACQQESPQVRIVNAPDYKKAETFLDRRNDSAFYYFNRFVAGSKDSLHIGMAYNYMASIQSGAGDHFGGQESLLMSLKFLDAGKEKDRKCLSSTYNELGMTSFDLKNYDAAIGFYDQAIRLSSDDQLKAVVLNNKANAYQKKGDYLQALRLYQEVIAGMRPNGTAYARILTNVATTKWLAAPRYNAGPELLKALRIRQQQNDLWGENSSYAHLADYYAHRAPDSALRYAREMYAVACRLNSPDDQLEALEKLIRLMQPKNYFARYIQLDDSLQTARNAAKNQFALIRYQAEKNKADNLKLQKDNSEERYQLIRQRIALYSLVLLILAGSLIARLWYRKRSQRLRYEARQQIQENQLRTARKVHDVVANGLYRIMTGIEHREELDKEQLLDQMETVYEQTRDISGEDQPHPGQLFHQSLAAMLKSFGSKSTKVLLVGNQESLWQGLPAQTLYEVEHVLQELMVNMKKHSRATAVLLRFEKEGQTIRIDYTDDGTGRPEALKFGTGLTSTGNRIKNIRGTLSFEANGARGLRIRITFPTA
jgi:signal transduction histidine kinase